jgi:hypothetical protein
MSQFPGGGPDFNIEGMADMLMDHDEKLREHDEKLREYESILKRPYDDEKVEPIAVCKHGIMRGLFCQDCWDAVPGMIVEWPHESRSVRFRFWLRRWFW